MYILLSGSQMQVLAQVNSERSLILLSLQVAIMRSFQMRPHQRVRLNQIRSV